MKTTKRVLAVLLAILMLSSMLLVGCKKDEETVSDTVATAPSDGESFETDEYGQKIYNHGIPDSLDYKEKDVNILLRNQPGNVRVYEWKVDDYQGNVLNQAIFQRNVETEEFLNVVLNFTLQDEGTANASFNQAVVTSFNAGGADIDIISTNGYYGTAPSAMDAYMNLYNSKLTYLQLENPYWNQNYINAAKYNDKMFTVIGDMTLSAYMTSFVMVFNKTMLQEVTQNENAANDIYKMVLEGNWTFEEMKKLATNVYSDATGNGKTNDDRFGYSSHASSHAYDGYVAAFGVDLTRVDNGGNHKLLTDSDATRLNTYGQTLVDFYRTDDVWLETQTPTGGYVPPVATFKEGKVLFCVAGMGDCDNHLNSTWNSEGQPSYGILPLPKWDATAQTSYAAGVQDSHNVIAVMYGSEKTDEDYTCISAVLEYMNWKSYSTVRPALFEKVLKVGFSDADDAKVFDLVLTGTDWDFADVYGNNIVYPGTTNSIRNQCWRNQLSSAYKGNGQVAVSNALTGMNKTTLENTLADVDTWIKETY